MTKKCPVSADSGRRQPQNRLIRRQEAFAGQRALVGTKVLPISRPARNFDPPSSQFLRLTGSRPSSHPIFQEIRALEDPVGQICGNQLYYTGQGEGKQVEKDCPVGHVADEEPPGGALLVVSGPSLMAARG